jgi:hypothetical protein
MQRALAIALFVVFAVFSYLVCGDVGYIGFWKTTFATGVSVQIFTDLAIHAIAMCTFMVWHARRTGRNPWGYVAFTLALGSFGPLLYLILARAPVTLPR